MNDLLTYNPSNIYHMNGTKIILSQKRYLCYAAHNQFLAKDMSFIYSGKRSHLYLKCIFIYSDVSKRVAEIATNIT